MGFRINTNIDAMNAQRNLGVSALSFSKSVEKLSSGLRINRAADDAAGLSISEKLRGQVRGLNQAGRNAQDGISLIQTGEGALNEVHSILQRMRELSVQASNGTLTADDRASIQLEVDQLTAEITNVGNTTQFNTKTLLNGSATAAATAQNGTVALVGDITVDGANPAAATLTAGELAGAVDSLATGTNTQTGVYDVTVTAEAEGAIVGDAQVFALTASTQTITLNGVSIDFVANETLADITLKINNVTAQTGVVASTGGTNGGLQLNTDTVGSAATINVSGTSTFLENTGLSLAASGATVLSDAGTDVTGTINGEVATGTGNKLSLSLAGNDADGLSVTVNGSYDDATGLHVDAAASPLNFKAAVSAGGQINLQIGANSGQTISFSLSDSRAAALGVDTLDVSTEAGAAAAITSLDTAIKSVSDQRSTLGSIQNRLEHVIANLNVASENLAASESRIRDVDMAGEMVSFTKNQILQQAGTAILAQANQSSQSVLQLLR